MIHEGKEITPLQSFCLVRRRDKGTTDSGLVMPGEHGEFLEVVESSGRWVTVSGAVIEVDLRPGDRVYTRAPRPMGVSNVGQQLYDRVNIVAYPDWPQDVGLIALADIVAVERAAAS